MTTWHYVEHGAQVGPLTMDEMKDAIKNKKVTASTKVWPGEGDWIHASETLLSEFFYNRETTTPPPLASEDIDNRFMCILVAVPIAGVIIDLIAGATLFLPSIIANIVLCMLDEKKLKAAGHTAPAHWSIFIVPIYIWKRATLLNQKKHYFSAWVTAFIISIILSMSGAQADIEDAACPIVTDIIKKQFYGSSQCIDVTIDRELKNGFYIATATLDNGNELSITIEERDNDMIYVRIPRQ